MEWGCTRTPRTCYDCCRLYTIEKVAAEITTTPSRKQNKHSCSRHPPIYPSPIWTRPTTIAQLNILLNLWFHHSIPRDQSSDCRLPSYALSFLNSYMVQLAQDNLHSFSWLGCWLHSSSEDAKLMIVNALSGSCPAHWWESKYYALWSSTHLSCYPCK